MARATGKVLELLRPNTAYAEDSQFVQIDATDGIAFTITERDDKYIFCVKNSDETNAEELTIKGGTHGAVGGIDLKLTIAKDTTAWFALDTARFKVLTGADNGKIIMAGSADLSVACYRLP